MNATLLPLRRRLKHATAPAHAALEARIGPLVTQSAYNEYVRGLHAFRATAEDWLTQHGLTGIARWKPQNIAAVIRQDINDLALQPLELHPAKWVAGAGRSFALGVHYVLEGSALGARVLCRQVAALGLHRGHGARHLWAQAEAPESWRGFLDILNAHDGDESALVAGADAAFEAAATSMERAANG